MKLAMMRFVLCSILLSLNVSKAVNVPVALEYYSKMNELIYSSTIVDKTTPLKLNQTLDSYHNGSVIETEDGYVAVLRNETKRLLCNLCLIRVSEFKLAYLDKSFQQVGELKTIHISPSFEPEDPRLFKLGSNYYLTYNDEIAPHVHTKQPITFPTRRLWVGKLDIKTATITHAKPIKHVDFELNNIEKNWAPFEYPHNSGKLYFIYTSSPYHIISVNEFDDELFGLTMPTKKCIPYRNQYLSTPLWNSDLWGNIRGGTPARFVDGVYLTFFHAWRPCADGRNYFYVMGAYTFEAKPPFRMLTITPDPIFFKEAYSGPSRDDHIRTVYPAGFAIEKNDNTTMLHVSCGENDIMTRIVSIDKDVLFNNMVNVPTIENR